MGKKQIIKICTDGMFVEGVYTDILQGLGEMEVCRASSVEFNDEINQWVVEMKIGPFANSCLSKTFDRRTDALAAEVELLTEQHGMCLI